MNSIFKIIAFPITLIIGIISALFVVGLNFKTIGLVKDNKLSKGELVKKLYSDFDHFVLYEEWIKTPPFFRMAIAGIIYYFIIKYL